MRAAVTAVQPAFQFSSFATCCSHNSTRGKNYKAVHIKHKERHPKGVAKVSMEKLSKYPVLLSKSDLKKTTKSNRFTLLESDLPSPQQSFARVRE
jgi:hypothetical protein